MILRKSGLLCVRTNIGQCRSISMSWPKSNGEKSSAGQILGKGKLPSREYFQQLTEKSFMEEQFIRSGRKPFEVMLEKPIVVKNFFVSEIESEEIKYPEMLSPSDFDKWKKTNEQISKHLPKPNEFIGNDQLNALKKFNLFGYNVPKEFGGQNCSHTELSVASETENENIAIAIALNGHRLVCETIKQNCTIAQCEKYLPLLASGEFIATTAFQECNSIEQTGFNTRAEYDDDYSEWCLNGMSAVVCCLWFCLIRWNLFSGTKSFVANAPNANLFLVLAQTIVSDRQGDMKDSLTLFLVDKSMPGIEIHKEDKTIGLNNALQSKVTFNDIVIPKGKQTKYSRMKLYGKLMMIEINRI